MGILKGQTLGDISKDVNEKLCLPLYELSDSEDLGDVGILMGPTPGDISKHVHKIIV